MPVLALSDYQPPLLWRNRHLQTIVPSLYRKTPRFEYLRTRLDTPDGDFLDLDWLTSDPSDEGRKADGGREADKRRKIAVLCHGLEGSSRSLHARAMAHVLFLNGWDVVAWNYRGCGGTPNLLPRSYHSGATEDLALVMRHVEQSGRYDRAHLIGFSLGGNLVVKYLGEEGHHARPFIRRAVAFSVPFDLECAATTLALPSRKLYMRAFLKDLKRKLAPKAERWPHIVSLDGFDKITNFREYDGRYTAPLHGFESAEHYWQSCSARHFMRQVVVPTLVVNSSDDPFLGPRCFPREEAAASEHVYLETPRFGGHLGFIPSSRDGLYWSERRTLAFLAEAENE